jgi:hypothetical protein
MCIFLIEFNLILIIFISKVSLQFYSEFNNIFTIIAPFQSFDRSTFGSYLNTTENISPNNIYFTLRSGLVNAINTHLRLKISCCVKTN